MHDNLEVYLSQKYQIMCSYLNFNHFSGHGICDLLITQNQSAAGNVIQLKKKEKPNYKHLKAQEGKGYPCEYCSKILRLFSSKNITSLSTLGYTGLIARCVEKGLTEQYYTRNTWLITILGNVNRHFHVSSYRLLQVNGVPAGSGKMLRHFSAGEF